MQNVHMYAKAILSTRPSMREGDAIVRETREGGGVTIDAELKLHDFRSVLGPQRLVVLLGVLDPHAVLRWTDLGEDSVGVPLVLVVVIHCMHIVTCLRLRKERVLFEKRVR